MTRVTGTVVEFKPRKGSGLIKLDDAGEKDKPIFVHWSNIETDDKWPALSKDMEVELELGEDEKKKGKKVALKVTQPGGAKIVHDPNAHKNYDTTTYKGTVAFFDKKKGFGMIIPEEEIEFDGKTASKKVGKHLAVGREDVKTTGEVPALDDGAEVEFVVYATEGHDQLGAGKVTGPDGADYEYKGEHKKRKFQSKGNQQNKRRKMNNNQQVEVGLFILAKHVGPIIGKKAEDIKLLQKQTKCTKIQFGRKNIGNGEKARCVLSIQGWPSCVNKAIKRVAHKIAELKEAEDLQLTFLVPAEYCGIFMGKKGGFVKYISKASDCQLRVLKNHIQLPGASEVALAALKGPVDDFKEAIPEITNKLAMISEKVRSDAQELKAQMGMMRGMAGMAALLGGGGGFGGQRKQGGWRSSNSGGWNNKRRWNNNRRNKW